MSVESEFLNFSAEKLTQLLKRIETCVDRLTPEQLWTRGSDHENAVGNLMLHLAGNVRQWILAGVGGAPDHRDRDREFAARTGAGAQELKAELRSAVEEAVALIRALPPQRLCETIRPQGYEGTVLAAIYHVVEHFAGHAFQIMFATKLLTGADLGFYATSTARRPIAKKFPRPCGAAFSGRSRLFSRLLRRRAEAQRQARLPHVQKWTTETLKMV